MSIQIVEIAQPSVIDTVAVAQPSTVAVVEVRQGPAGTGGGSGSNSVTSATTSDGTADLSISNVTTATAEVTGTLTANHIHGNLAGSVYAHVRAGEALAKGDPVYVSGFHNGTSTAEVSKADASNAAKMPAIGIMDANLAHNATGHMVITGTITDVNTAGYTVNAELYVAAGGGMTATPPTARAQPVARVERVNLNNGAIIVKVNGLSASDNIPSTLVRRNANGDASFSAVDAGALTAAGISTTGQVEFNGTDAGDSLTFNMVNYTYGTGAASAHRFALNGGAATGDALFTAASPAAARTTLELGSTNTPTFGGLDLLTSTTTTLNVYNSLSEANFERLSFRWASNIARIGTAKGGTGTARDLVLETDGTERVRVLSTGNVGIGTSSPGVKLDILGDASSSNNAYSRLTRGANTSDAFVITKPTGALSAANPQYSYGIAANTSYFSFQRYNGTTATSDISISTTGNVGIGTTAPGGQLQINNTAANRFVVESTGRAHIGEPTGSSYQYSVFNISADEPALNYGATINLEDTRAVAAGIGSRVLMGSRYDTNLLTGGVSFGAFKENATLGNYAYSFTIGTRANGGNITEKLRIDSAGNVGIGTTAPTALLDVNSNTVRLRTARTPASATAAGNAGDICWDANYIYVCTATNTWKRTAISTWP